MSWKFPEWIQALIFNFCVRKMSYISQNITVIISRLQQQALSHYSHSGWTKMSSFNFRWYSIISFTIQIIFLFNRFHIHSYVVSGRLKGQIFFLSALIYPIDFFLKLHYIFSCLWKFRLIFPIFNYLNNLCFTKYKTCFIPSIDFSIVSVNQFISSLGWVVVFLGGGTVITRPVPTSKMGWIQNLCHALCDA